MGGLKTTLLHTTIPVRSGALICVKIRVYNTFQNFHKDMNPNLYSQSLAELHKDLPAGVVATSLDVYLSTMRGLLWKYRGVELPHRSEGDEVMRKLMMEKLAICLSCTPCMANFLSNPSPVFRKQSLLKVLTSGRLSSLSTMPRLLQPMR